MSNEVHHIIKSETGETLPVTVQLDESFICVRFPTLKSKDGFCVDVYFDLFSHQLKILWQDESTVLSDHEDLTAAVLVDNISRFGE